jgi:hypothetical protein
MSNLTFNKLWNESHQQLLDQLEYETPKDPSMVPKEKESAFQHLAVLYIRYIQIFRNLEVTYPILCDSYVLMANNYHDTWHLLFQSIYDHANRWHMIR